MNDILLFFDIFKGKLFILKKKS